MINKTWDKVLEKEMKKDYFKELGFFVKSEYRKHICYPDYINIFNALRYTDYDDVKVVILGQDPYHGEGEAHGLSFSVLPGVRRPPSLDNIFSLPLDSYIRLPYIPLACVLVNPLSIKNYTISLLEFSEECTCVGYTILSQLHPINLLDSGFTTSYTLLIKGSGIKDSDYIGVDS